MVARTKKTSELTTGVALDGSEALHVVQAGKSRRTTIAAIVIYVQAVFESVFTAITNALDGKASQQQLIDGLAGKLDASAYNEQITALTSTVSGKANLASGSTGTVISFATPQIYGSVATPETGNISVNLTGAVIGAVQKIYHNGPVPTYSEGWVCVGDGKDDLNKGYVLGELNIIFCEWSYGTRVEFWIVQ